MPKAQYLTLPTTLSTEQLTERLRAAQPWGHRIDFDNGVSTTDFERRIPFNANPLSKFSAAAKVVPFDDLRGGTLLDIGSNSGHNAINAAVQYGMRVTGIDVTERHMDMSNFLADLADVDAEFRIENAETFCRPGFYDVVLHFGTLYHLPNPLLSLQTTFENLKPGGYLALETQTYDDPRNLNLCAYIHMVNNDPTNFWAISEHVLRRHLEFIGMTEIQTLVRATPKVLQEQGLTHQHRILMTARKPD